MNRDPHGVQDAPRANVPCAPQVVVCAGGGGVGKTTVAAALALASARRGCSTLIVTIDPAQLQAARAVARQSTP